MHRSPIITRKNCIVTRRNIPQIGLRCLVPLRVPPTQACGSAVVGPQQALDDFTTRLHSTIVNILDELAPLRNVIRRQPGPGHIVISAKAPNAKARRRRLERSMIQSGGGVILRKGCISSCVPSCSSLDY